MKIKGFGNIKSLAVKEYNAHFPHVNVEPGHPNLLVWKRLPSPIDWLCRAGYLSLA